MLVNIPNGNFCAFGVKNKDGVFSIAATCDRYFGGKCTLYNEDLNKQHAWAQGWVKCDRCLSKEPLFIAECEEKTYGK